MGSFGLSVAGKQRRQKEEIMKEKIDDDMLPEYDFSGDVIHRIYGEEIERSNTVRIIQQNGDVITHYYTEEDGAVMLSPDVRAYFPDSEAVNTVLRALIPAIQKAKEQTQ